MSREVLISYYWVRINFKGFGEATPGAKRRARVSMSEKGSTNLERRKTRKNTVVLEWNWRYQSEIMAFNIYRLIQMFVYAYMHVYVYVYKYYKPSNHKHWPYKAWYASCFWGTISKLSSAALISSCHHSVILIN